MVNRKRQLRTRNGPAAGCVILLAGAILLVLLWPRVLEAYARWLVVEDPIRRSDALVTLSGGDGERLMAAIQLYKRDLGGKLVIVGPDAPFLKVYTGEDSLTQGEAKRRIAVRKGIPPDSIVLALGATSTWDEAESTLREARARGWKSCIVITDPFHTRRARATFRHVLRPTGIEVSVYHLPLGRSSQNVPRWWTRESDTMAVMTETIKILFYMYKYRIFP